jgi:dTMP kinase
MHGKSKAQWISLSGIDGSGKSTQCRALALRLHAAGLSTRVFSYRAGEDHRFSRAMSLIRAETHEAPPHEDTIAALHAGDYVAAVAGLLQEHRLVDVFVSDRYVADLMVTQRVAFGASFSEGRRLLSACPRPRSSFLLDLPPHIAAERIRSRGGESKWLEARDVLERKRDCYLSVAGDEGFVVIDASQDAGLIADDIWRHVVGHLAHGGM